MDHIEQIIEANARLNKALQSLKRHDFDCFTEHEVLFRIDTIANAILIVQSDLRSMKEEWQKAVEQRLQSDKGKDAVDLAFDQIVEDTVYGEGA